ncbi:MAG: TonB-dependent receptor [Sphingomonadaceae bacterium]|nr:TonB-dependent receptor [Sphingomonadaceae bacterium]
MPGSAVRGGLIGLAALAMPSAATTPAGNGALIVPGDAFGAADVGDLEELARFLAPLVAAPAASAASSADLKLRGLGGALPPGILPRLEVRAGGAPRGRIGTRLAELGTLEAARLVPGPAGGTVAGRLDLALAPPGAEAVGDWRLAKGTNGLWRLGGGVTQSVMADRAQLRVDGWWDRRDGWLRDPAGGAEWNDRAGWLVRAGLAFSPRDDVHLVLSADWTRRRDDWCCTGAYLPAGAAAPIAQALRGLGATLIDDPAALRAALTPGRRPKAGLGDRGIDLALTAPVGSSKLTARTTLRDGWARQSGDADGLDLDLLARGGRCQRATFFAQELALEADEGSFRWWVGAGITRERLVVRDDLRFGTDATRAVDAVLGVADPTFPGLAVVAAELGLPGVALDGQGVVADRWRQVETAGYLEAGARLTLAPTLDLAAGLRRQRVVGALEARLDGDNPLCQALLAAGRPREARLACAVPGLDAALDRRRRAAATTGEVNLGWRPVPSLSFEARHATGFRPAGFVLDRRALDPTSPEAPWLAPERGAGQTLEVRFGMGRRHVALRGFRTRVRRLPFVAEAGERVVAQALAGCAEGAEPCGARSSALALRGVEGEARLQPARDLSLALGLARLKARYAAQLVAADGGPLAPDVERLAGQAPAGAPGWAHTGQLLWEPPLGAGLRLRLLFDWRITTSFTSDPWGGARVPAHGVLNARVGLSGPERRWAMDLWVNNVTDTRVVPAATPAPLQGLDLGEARLRSGAPIAPRRLGFLLSTRF